MKKNLFAWIAGWMVISSCISCKKSKADPEPPSPPPPAGDTTIVPGTDPATANTIGFFLDDWQPKSFTAPAYDAVSIPSSASITVTVDATSIITKIPLSEFGHNAFGGWAL
ncbi:MAG: hypothetical protein WDO16_06705 [Bacteroidota bacterium]